MTKALFAHMFKHMVVFFGSPSKHVRCDREVRWMPIRFSVFFKAVLPAQVWNYKLRRCLFTLLGHLDYIRTTFFHHVSTCGSNHYLRR